MHDRDQPPRLTVELTDGVGFAAALYVRDRFDLQVATRIPPLAPAVPPAGPAASVTQADWDHWWSTVAASTPSRYVAPPGGSSLAAAYAEVMGDAHDELITWVQDQHEESSRVIRAYHPAWLSPWVRDHHAEGRHVTEVVPVSGTWWLALSPRRLLVSVDLLRDHDAMDSLWRAQLGALEVP